MLSPKACEVLLGSIAPIMRTTVPKVVRPLPGETYDDLIADGIGEAAKALCAMERNGKPLLGSSVAYYAIQHLKVGRRMLDAGITDVYAAQRRRANDDIASFDEPIDFGDGEINTIEDVIPDHHPDPIEEVGRKMAWEDLAGYLTNQQRKVLQDMAEGRRSVETAKELGVSAPRVTTIKREIGEKIKLVMGENILNEIASESRWFSDLRCQRERRASKLAEPMNA